jgi:hypothetical protein
MESRAILDTKFVDVNNWGSETKNVFTLKKLKDILQKSLDFVETVHCNITIPLMTGIVFIRMIEKNTQNSVHNYYYAPE